MWQEQPHDIKQVLPQVTRRGSWAAAAAAAAPEGAELLKLPLVEALARSIHCLERLQQRAKLHEAHLAQIARCICLIGGHSSATATASAAAPAPAAARATAAVHGDRRCCFELEHDPTARPTRIGWVKQNDFLHVDAVILACVQAHVVHLSPLIHSMLLKPLICQRLPSGHCKGRRGWTRLDPRVD